MQEVLHKFFNALFSALDVDSVVEGIEDASYKLGDIRNGKLNAVDSGQNFARGFTDEAFEVINSARDDGLHLGDNGDQSPSGTVLSGDEGWQWSYTISHRRRNRK